MTRTLRSAATALAVCLLAGCGSSNHSAPLPVTQPSPSARPGPTDVRADTAPWPLPKNQVARMKANAIPLAADTDGFYAHLDVIVDGGAVQVPAGLGVPAGTDPHASAAEDGTLAAVHTDDDSGLLHVQESPQDATSGTVTLGQVFTEWGVLFGPGTVGAYALGDHETRNVQVYVNGERYASDPSMLALRPRQEIVVVAAPQETYPTTIPSHYRFPHTT